MPDIKAVIAMDEISTGERFAFGENWALFLENFTNEKLETAILTLKTSLEAETLTGKTFLDIGSGSGLSSLAARSLGANVISFDYDETSVACTQELKNRFFPDDLNWTIEHGSALDVDYIKNLGEFDITYSWGVLHHTGKMWQAIENSIATVKPGGIFLLAIYNDEGRASRAWLKIKKAYNSLPSSLRFLVLWPSFVRLWGPTIILDTLTGNPLKTWNSYGNDRGMSPWRDVIDWVGGYPFEVARPDEIFGFLKSRGFSLQGMKTITGHGCNEYVFRKNA